MGRSNAAKWTLLLLVCATHALVARAQLGTGNCEQDVYFLIDASEGVDLAACFGFGDSYAIWDAWRQQAAYILSLFQPMVDDGSINAGVQIYGRDVVTTANYDVAPTFASAISDLQTRTVPLCLARPSFVPFLAEAVDFNPQFTNWVYGGPNTLRPRDSTTRTAIVMTMTGEDGFQDADLLYRMQAVHDRFDNEIYITMRVADASLNSQREHQLRLAACGNLFHNCSNIFYTDMTNDFGVPISMEAFQELINPLACNSRPVTITDFTATCATGSIEFAIPTNLLVDLTSEDLQALDASCNLTHYTTVSGSNTVITLPIGACGAIEEASGDNTNVFQQITTRPGTPFVAHFNATCAYPNTVEETFGPLAPQGIVVAQNISEMTTYPLTLNIFKDSSFATPLTGSASIVVGCTLYIEAYTPLPNGLTMVMVSLVATPSSDPADTPSYPLVTDNCVLDDTFSYVLVFDPNIVRATFDMFQFAEDVGKPTAEKQSIYLHATFRVCLESDTSPSCSPGSCPVTKRRKRSDDEKYDSITQTVGPFYVESRKPADDDVTSHVVPVNDASSSDEGMNWVNRRIEVMIPGMSPPAYTVISHVIFLVVIVLLAALLLRHYMQKPSGVYLQSSPGVVPYHHCAKTPLRMQDCYVNTASLPPQCESCCERHVTIQEATQTEESQAEKPPQYEP